MTDTDFDVRATIRDLLTTTDLSEPSEVAEKLLADLTTEQRAEGFVQVAVLVVQNVMSRHRGRADDNGSESGDEKRPATKPGPRGAGTPTMTSADHAREWWQKILRDRYKGADGWLMLAEFSADDHDAAAHLRYEKAAEIHYRGEWHEACARAMRTYRVDRFDHLPESVLVNLIEQRRSGA